MADNSGHAIYAPHADPDLSSRPPPPIVTRDTSTTEEFPIPETSWVADTLSPTHEVSFVAIICMAQFSTQNALLGVLVILGDIGRTFGLEHRPAHLAWLIAGYSLTVGTFILVSGRLGDVFGHKKMLLIGFSWFSLWSLLAGFAVYANYTFLVFARTIQGIGPSLCLPNALAILGSAYAHGSHRKAMAFACFGAVAPMGGVVGAIAASLLSMVWWPWALWGMAVAYALTAAAAFFIIPNIPHKRTRCSSWRELAHVVDALPAVLAVVALVLFNFAWVQAPISGWATPTVLVPLILGILLFAVFSYMEMRVSKYPLLPFEAFKLDVCFILVSLVCGWATFGIWIMYLVLFLQNIRGIRPLITSLYFVPVILSGGVAALVTGKLLGPYRVGSPLVMVYALVAFTIGIILTAFVPTHQTYWGQIFLSMIIMPFGMDMSFPAATLTISNSVAKEHQGVGASLVTTVVNYGIALGVGIAGTVEIHGQGSGEPADKLLRGYRAGFYTAVGISVLGLGTVVVFLCKSTRKEGREKMLSG